ncbi:MAG: PilZ domain-containing protein [Candidatus Omnitrophica bacterium]|nr:PilZ domain-containing protein [Candidatus Omnitrophota bacterium]
MQEKRRYSRYLTDGKVILKLKDGSGRSIKADLVDISMVGMGMYSREKISPGIETSFVLIHKYWDNPVIGSGKVRYSLEVKRDGDAIFRVGVEFGNLMEQGSVEFIVDRIQENLPKSKF